MHGTTMKITSTYIVITQVLAEIYLQHTSYCNAAAKSENIITVGPFILEIVSWE
jgi:hypothetical protein